MKVHNQELTEDEIFTKEDIEQFNKSLPDNSDSCGCAAKAERLAQLQAEAKKRDLEDANRSVLVAVGSGFVSFSDGNHYSVGEMIEDGTHEGKRILRIDYAKRRCLISGGDWLRLSTNKPKNYDQPAEQLSTALSRTEASTEPATTGTNKTERSILINRRREYEASRPSDTTGQTDGPVIRR